MPSSLYSNAAGPSSANASSTLSAVFASMGLMGRNNSLFRPPTPPLAPFPKSPASISARRTSAAGSSRALASASIMIPSSAPCRSSPVNRRNRKSCSSLVALPNSSLRSRCFSPADPFPAAFPIFSNVSATSLTCRRAESATCVLAFCKVAQPHQPSAGPDRTDRRSPFRSRRAALASADQRGGESSRVVRTCRRLGSTSERGCPAASCKLRSQNSLEIARGAIVERRADLLELEATRDQTPHRGRPAPLQLEQIFYALLEVLPLGVHRAEHDAIAQHHAIVELVGRHRRRLVAARHDQHAEQIDSEHA